MDNTHDEKDPSGSAALQARFLENASWLKQFIAKRIADEFKTLVTVDDLLQDVWVSVLAEYPRRRLSGPHAFERLLTKIARCRIADARRRIGARKRGGLRRILRLGVGRSSSTTAVYDVRAAQQKTPSREAATGEAGRAIELAICTLPPERRKIVRMHYFEGRSIAAIARTTLKTFAAVRSQLYRSRKQLLAQLGTECRYFSDVRSKVTGRE